MKAVLFCSQPYAFGILKPLHEELRCQGHQVLWYVSPGIAERFPFDVDTSRTSAIADVLAYQADAHFVPGNSVPHYLRGVKVQVFHGLAGEKKSHFHIRHYFDLYLTQGPYFTRGFEQIARRHRNFTVRETGWCKLDPLYSERARWRAERDTLLTRKKLDSLVLYAPTFSGDLTSASSVWSHVPDLLDRNDIYLIIKFHDLMDKSVVARYRQLAAGRTNIEISDDPNILRVLGMADLLISDTSSVVYEFMLLDKPVITIRSRSPDIRWPDLRSAAGLVGAVREELREDRFQRQRQEIAASYHPYVDGRSSARMIRAVEDYIERYGVPEVRQLSRYRKRMIHRRYGKSPEAV